MSVTGSAVRSYCAEHCDGGLLVVGRLQRDESPIHQVATRVARLGEQELADAHVVDQQPVVVDDVDDVERLAVLPVRADVIEHLLRRSSPRGRAT